MSATRPCAEIEPLLLGHARGALSAAEGAEVAAHLEHCPACARLVIAEGALDDALGRLPQHAAPVALKRRLRAAWPAPRPHRRPPRAILVGVAVLAAAAVLVALVVRGPARPPGGSVVAEEALADHLRIVTSAHPLDVESGGVHQVKPWFAGRLDFAPRVPEAGDDFPLTGGAVALFDGRKAAAFVYRRRLHTISLFVVPLAGLEWPAGAEPAARSARGFHLVFWSRAELGYALVSDVDAADLQLLAGRLAGGE